MRLKNDRPKVHVDLSEVEQINGNVAWSLRSAGLDSGVPIYVYMGVKLRWLVTRESMVVSDADDDASCIEKASFRGRNKNYQCVFCSIG